MQVTLLHNSPLDVVVKAIRKCYASEDKSDSGDAQQHLYYKWLLGPKDKALIQNVIKNDHTSTLEHLSFTFDISGLSRAALQELARHRHASLSVQSTRYTLGKIKEADDLGEFLIDTGSATVNEEAYHLLCNVQTILCDEAIPNDYAKYMLPESFKTSLIWTINARSLRNFLKLRSDKRALWEMRELAEKVYQLIPADIKFIFEDCMENTNA